MKVLEGVVVVDQDQGEITLQYQAIVGEACKAQDPMEGNQNQLGGNQDPVGEGQDLEGKDRDPMEDQGLVKELLKDLDLVGEDQEQVEGVSKDLCLLEKDLDQLEPTIANQVHKEAVDDQT